MFIYGNTSKGVFSTLMHILITNPAFTTFVLNREQFEDDLTQLNNSTHHRIHCISLVEGEMK